MNRIILFFMLLLAVATARGAEAAGACIVFDEKVHDFGEIREDAGKVSAIFTFANTGNAPLVIVDAKTSCGCTSPTFPKKAVAPGAKGKVSVTFNPKGQPSSFSKVITVFTNDPKAKRVKLRIKGKIKR